MIRLWEIAALGLIIGTCVIHAHRFAANKSVGPLFHTIWAVIYFAPLLLISWFEASWVLALAFVIERFFFYNPVLNLIRHRPFFYLSVKSDHPSWWDELEIKWRAAYPYVWALSGAALITTTIVLK